MSNFVVNTGRADDLAPLCTMISVGSDGPVRIP